MNISLIRQSLIGASLVALVSLPSSAQELWLNEIVPSNDGAIFLDDDNEASDWIEIFYQGTEALDLEGYGLSDDPDDPMKWVFPAVQITPGMHLVVFASDKDRREPGENLHTNFKLSQAGEYLAISNPAGEVLDAFTPTFPETERGMAYGRTSDGGTELTFLAPTPGESNQEAGPHIEWTDYSPKPASADQDLIITAKIASDSPLSEVILRSRVMFRTVTETPMTDDGVAPDETAEDGIYTGTIKSTTLFGRLLPGYAVRWAVTAVDEEMREGRFPLWADPAITEEYTGTVVEDPTIDTQLPILYHFVENENAINTVGGTRGMISFNGEFYDNVFMRLRGGTAVNWPKKSYKLEFPDDHHLLFDPDLPRVDEFNLNATYTDKSYVRAILASELHQLAGTPSPITFPLRVQRNGEFFSVALFVEQPDKDFLRRNNLDPDGVYYKANPGSTYAGGTGSFEKKTRRDEGKEDLEAFLAGLRLPASEKERYLFDHADIPAQISFMAGIAITQNIDDSDKNHFLYRDTLGNGEWEMTPWDLDLTFGPDALNTDYIIADESHQGATYPNASHLFIGSRAFPLHDGKYNDFLDALFTTPRTKDMYLRRVRSLHDQYLASDYFDRRLDELLALYEKDTIEDRERWGTQSHFPGRRDTMRETVERIKTEYLVPRRAFIEGGGGVGVPASQPDDASLTIAEVDFDPASGDQDEEYVKLINPNGYSLDLSGWQIEGGISHTFKPGTVIPAANLFSPDRNILYVVKRASAFRSREQGPSGGAGLFLQGDYDGNLSSEGEELRLLDDQGRLVTSFTYEGVTPTRSALVITEILAAPLGSADAEFIELMNIGAEVLDLTGFHFTDGVEFDFATSAITSLSPGERILVILNQEAFEAQHGTGLPVAGEFLSGTRLDNAGELLRIEHIESGAFDAVTYSDQTPWPNVRETGHSLVLRDPASADPSDVSQWRSSNQVGGDPGADDSASGFEGDPFVDLDGDGQVSLVEYALGTSDQDAADQAVLWISPETSSGRFEGWHPQRQGAEDVEVSLEGTADLTNWEAAEVEGHQFEEREGHPGVSFQIERTSNWRFLRLRIELK